MKNLFKKISALVLTAIMVLTMCSAVFADGTTLSKPSAGDKASITVKNVEENATVTAYRVVEPVYTNEGFEKYQKVSNNKVSIANPVKPTVEEIVNIAKGIADGTISGLESVTLTRNAQSGDYTNDQAGAGYWVVLVTGNVNKVYNPMLAGVYYSVEGSGSSNELKNEAIDASQKWILNSVTAHDKSIDVAQTVSKKIANSDAKKLDGTDSIKGDDIAIGDVAQFEVKATIPKYTKAYSQVTFKITDTLDSTFKSPTNVKVFVDNGSVSATDDKAKTYTVTIVANEITIDFDSAFALSKAGSEVKLTYNAELDNDANTNFVPNVNTVKVTYTKDPTTTTTNSKTVDTEEHKTYHYTFELGGEVNGSETDKTTIFKKTGEEIVNGETKYNPLPGAEFTLTRVDKVNEKYVYTALSDANGSLNFKGLEAGRYTLKETKAPNGYSLNSTVFNVNITAKYNEDGTLNNYKVEVKKDGEETGAEFTYTKNGENIVIGNDTPYEIKNTKLSSLPSTGGMGTYLFTIVGVVLMTCAAGAFFVSRRKTNK